MLYEWREYRAVPGKEKELLRRFQEHTFDLFAKHGIEIVGFWAYEDDPTCLVYLCRFENKTHREQAWNNFQSDPVWQEIKKRSEAQGPLTRSIESKLLVDLGWERQL